MEKERIKELLGRLLMEVYERLPIPQNKRDTAITEIPGKIAAVIGMRRVGKTYLLYEKMAELIQSGVDKKQIFYLNFEDDRLPPLNKEMLASLIDSFYSLFPENHSRHCWLFFDEIQYAENWAKVLRRLLDTKDASLFVTGSSSKMLSTEIATTVRGRSISTEVWPLSFKEYAQGIAFSLPKSPLSPKMEDELTAFLTKYLQVGGFPETIAYSDLDRRRIHQDYVSVVILKDIVERYDIQNEPLLRYVIKFLLSNIGKPFSINKLYNDLKSQGRSLGKNTLYEYLTYISDCYLAFTVPLYTDSLRKQESNPRKIYAIDTGLASSHIIGINSQLGRLFENLVYLDLRRRRCEIYYYLTPTGKEVDFVARSEEGRFFLLQVCYEMGNETTAAREKEALREAEKELGMPGIIVSPANYLTFLNDLL